MKNKIRKIANGLFELPGESLSSGYLIGSRCSDCGCTSYPKRMVCPDCLKRDSMQQVALSRRGTLYSFAVNQMAPEGFEAPYIIGKVDLPEKIRIFAMITGCEPREDALFIGMEMELVFEVIKKDAEGRELIGYKFKPAAPVKAQPAEGEHG